jgi:hypothetical protein
MRATGLVDDVTVLAMLETLLDAPGYRVKALYHTRACARTLAAQRVPSANITV